MPGAFMSFSRLSENLGPQTVKEPLLSSLWGSPPRIYDNKHVVNTRNSKRVCEGALARSALVSPGTLFKGGPWGLVVA